MTKKADSSTWAAISKYAKWAASDFDRTGHHALVGKFVRDGWRVAPDGAMRRQQTEQAIPIKLFDALKEANPELWDLAVIAVKKDPLFAPWEGGMVGTAMSAMAFTAVDVVNYCIAGQVTNDGEFLHDEERVRARFIEVEKYFALDFAVATVLIPLPGLKINLPRPRFDLSDRIVFTKFTAEEFEHCAESGIILPMFAQSPIFGPEYSFGCRVTVDVPTVRFPPGSLSSTSAFGDRKKRAFGELGWWAVDEVVEDILFTLRLAGTEKIVAPGAMSINEGMGGRTVHAFRRATTPFVVTNYAIDEKIAMRMHELWSALAESKHKRRLPRICVRRFNAAVDRIGVEDAVADITIAAEALFLSDSQAVREELGYRLRLRAAKLMSNFGYEYAEVMKTLSLAYKLRSTVVHGGVLDDTIKLDGVEVRLDEFVSRLLNLMRNALAVCATNYATDSTFATTEYWEQLIFVGK